MTAESGSRLEWLRARSDLNHAWLKGRYLMHIDGWLEGRAYGAKSALDADGFLQLDLPEWVGRAPELLALVTAFEYRLSPARILDDWSSQALLSTASAATLQRLVHDLWVLRTGARETSARACRAVVRANCAYERVQRAVALLPGDPAGPNFAGLNSALRVFRLECGRVAECLEHLGRVTWAF